MTWRRMLVRSASRAFIAVVRSAVSRARVSVVMLAIVPVPAGLRTGIPAVEPGQPTSAAPSAASEPSRDRAR